MEAGKNAICLSTIDRIDHLLYSRTIRRQNASSCQDQLSVMFPDRGFHL